jgi:p21-activated kinase 1
VRDADLLSDKRKIDISTPYDPIHLTHVGFNNATGEFTGLPKEWQQLLADSGISKQDQATNPQAIVDVVTFYQDATKQEAVRPGAADDEVWNKFGHVSPTEPQQARFENPRAAPPPPPVGANGTLKSLRGPPDNRASTLGRSTSYRLPPTVPPPGSRLDRSASQRAPSASKPTYQPTRPPPPPPSRPAPPSSTGAKVQGEITPSKSPSASVGSNERATTPQDGSLPAPPRRRERKPKMSDADVIERLKAICTDADPTKLYRSLVKIGQG